MPLNKKITADILTVNDGDLVSNRGRVYSDLQDNFWIENCGWKVQSTGQLIPWVHYGMIRVQWPGLKSGRLRHEPSTLHTEPQNRSLSWCHLLSSVILKIVYASFSRHVTNGWAPLRTFHLNELQNTFIMVATSMVILHQTMGELFKSMPTGPVLYIWCSIHQQFAAIPSNQWSHIWHSSGGCRYRCLSKIWLF